MRQRGEAMKRLNLLNQKFDRWLVIEKDPRRVHRQVKWVCRCECGRVAVVEGGSLRGGKSRSCGCLQKEKTITHGQTIGMSAPGRKLDRLYRCWGSMKTRCSNPNIKASKYYGGISVCSDWLQFENFRVWALSHGYGDRLEIHRVDSSGDYGPGNCEWLTKSAHGRKRGGTCVIAA